MRAIRFDVGAGGMHFVGDRRIGMFFATFFIAKSAAFFVTQTENFGIEIARQSAIFAGHFLRERKIPPGRLSERYAVFVEARFG